MTDEAGHKLFFNLYTDEARTDVWGSWFASTKGPTIDAPLGRSEKTIGTAVIYGRIQSGQKDVPPGIYKTSISGSQQVTTYDYAKVGQCIGSIHGPYGRTALNITARVSGSSNDSTLPMVAPDATHPINGVGARSSVRSGDQDDSERKSVWQKLMDNAEYQRAKQQQTRTSDERSTQDDTQKKADRAAYLETHSCMTTAGAERANALSDECMKVTDAPHSACKIQENSCDEITAATKRGCNGLAAEGPDFCLTRYR